MRTTLMGWVAGILHFALSPDVKHALVGLALAVLGTLAQDAKKVETP